MDHFKGISEQERYNNDLLSEMRKINTQLEQIAQLLQQQNTLKPTTRRKS